LEDGLKMEVLMIPVKFNKEDTIYTTKQVSEEKICDLCNGDKTITYNGKEIKCPQCSGLGKITTNKKTNVVIEEPFRISSIDIKIKTDGTATRIKYRGGCGNTKLNRTEDNLFATKEEAKSKCDYLNKERKTVRVEDIIIQDSFKYNKPSVEKIIDRLNYYNDKKKFSKEILVDGNNVLLDGYITYLASKMLDLDSVRVVVDESVKEGE
jgi:excinuclease UvrABC ATPase subunit